MTDPTTTKTQEGNDWRKSAVRSLRAKARIARKQQASLTYHDDFLYERAMWCDELAAEIEDRAKVGAK